MFKGINNVVIFCSNTEASKAWYEKAGFTTKRAYEGMFWLDAGRGDEVMLHPTAEKPSGMRTVIHVAVADVRGLFKKVKANGLRPYDHQDPKKDISEPVTMPWGAIEFEMSDPDGTRWAFTQIADNR
jgi:uncharacterized glyoxalase superfamily protein PhnB